jgi:hypothetical protein
VQNAALSKMRQIGESPVQINFNNFDVLFECDVLLTVFVSNPKLDEECFIETWRNPKLVAN